MIDIYNQVFSRVTDTLLEVFPGIETGGDFMSAPSHLPFLSIIEMDNATYRRTQDLEAMEHHATIMHQVDAFSNLESGKKEQCREIMAVADREYQLLGFTRIFMSPTPNLEAPSIYRITARYRAVVARDGTVYRQ